MSTSQKQRRAVVVTRPSGYQSLVAHHGTHQQARFFLETRGQSIEPVLEQHQRFEAALHHVLQAIPIAWRRAHVSREDLDRFLFEPDDIILALGQDGLVANTAKYLNGQMLIGLNPDPSQYAGVLVSLDPAGTGDWLAMVARGDGTCELRTMVEAQLDDGQRLLALNEVFVGHATHQSARYELTVNGQLELQSSSGLIVSTGTGATGWALSMHRQQNSALSLPRPEEPRLIYFVREAWPSPQTGTQLTSGLLERAEQLAVTSRMQEGGVIFGDGIEQDRLEFPWGRRVTIRIAATRLNLFRG